MIAEFVGGAVDVAALETGSSQPDRETVRMVVATVLHAAPRFDTRRAGSPGKEQGKGLGYLTDY